ncbi:MAG: hypothetical protein AAGU78_17375, partial [Chloroflexota bacterium]
RPRYGILLFVLFNLPYLTRIGTVSDPPVALLTASLAVTWLALLWLASAGELAVSQRNAEPFAKTA